MHKLTEINLSIQRNKYLRREIFPRSADGAVFFKLNRQPSNAGSQKIMLGGNYMTAHPETICADISTISVLDLKVYIAWHHCPSFEWNLDPSNLVVFAAGSAIPLPVITDILDGRYGVHSTTKPLMVIHRDGPSILSPIQWLRYRWSRCQKWYLGLYILREFRIRGGIPRLHYNYIEPIVSGIYYDESGFFNVNFRWILVYWMRLPRLLVISTKQIYKPRCKHL